MAQTKAELVEELETLTTKADLVEILGKRLLKDDLVSLLEDESGATKEELVHKLESRRKDELIEAVNKHLTKDDLEKVVDERRPDEEDDEDDASEEAQEPKRQEPRQSEQQKQPEPDEEDEDEDEEPEQSNQQQRDQGNKPARRVVRDESTDIDWSAELEWAPPPRPTPAPVLFAGAAPYQPGQRVRVDLAGLPMLGVFAGKGASAAGTITGVDAQGRTVRVYLDAVFGGEKELNLPPERVQPDT
ncbi:MAG: hypothetical protein QOG85_2115 [Gaiellaceae bacterium]|jgi:outer membrane biosynthesis protein TonB|nr:hypothetical protein [Gaiellaceae bacterium]